MFARSTPGASARVRDGIVLAEKCTGAARTACTVPVVARAQARARRVVLGLHVTASAGGAVAAADVLLIEVYES